MFDYLEPKSKKIYYISFRIIKFLLPNGTTEYTYTNLPKEDFILDEIRELYNRRWGIETSFRDIKYAAGMLFFHSRKNSVIPEMSGWDCVRKSTDSAPMSSPAPLNSSTSYLTVGRYLNSSELLRLME